jgi:1,4-dihydroxy-2-naphthoate octaprenyltransferase
MPTKIASAMPVIGAVLFYIYNYSASNGINILNFILIYISILCVDMSTTGLNHYLSFETEKNNQSSYILNLEKMMDELNITRKDNFMIIAVMIGIALSIGIVVSILSNIGVFLLGALCALVGLLYSYGPKPICSTPVGEFFAGGIEGIVLPVAVIFSQYDHLPFELNPTLIIVFFPFAFLIGSLLLANNVCDIEKDVANGRYTLAYYLGKKNSVKAMYLGAIGAIISIWLAVALGYLNNWYLILTFSIIFLFLNIKAFAKVIIKEVSFKLIVLNFTQFSLFYIICLVIFK